MVECQSELSFPETHSSRGGQLLKWQQEGGSMADQPAIEIYPIPLSPTLSVADVAASLEWYTNKVGFVSVFNMAGDTR